MTEQLVNIVDRRRFLTQVMPACSLACLWAGAVGGAGAASPDATNDDEQHKFDVEAEMKMSPSQRVSFQNGNFIAFNKNFKMERDKTLMQGDAYCNHRYLDTT
jgi:hypothetical protein